MYRTGDNPSPPPGTQGKDHDMLTITTADTSQVVEIDNRGPFGVEYDVPQHIVDDIAVDVAEGFTFGSKYDESTRRSFGWHTAA